MSLPKAIAISISVCSFLCTSLIFAVTFALPPTPVVRAEVTNGVTLDDALPTHSFEISGKVSSEDQLVEIAENSSINQQENGTSAELDLLLNEGQAFDKLWVVRVQIEEDASILDLVNRYDVWAVARQDGYLTALVTYEEWMELEASGFQVNVDADRMKRLAQVEQIRALERNNAFGAFGGSSAHGGGVGIPGFSCYRTVEETYADLRELANNNPNLVQWVDIGDSWDKKIPGGVDGYDIYAAILTNQENMLPKPRFFVLAAVHARELTTSELVTRFAERLVTRYGVDADITWLLDYAEIHIVPHGNPDGRKQAENLIYWRKNRNLTSDTCPGTPSITYHGGVDLNRNSSFQWNQCDGFNCSSSNSCTQTYRGTAPASEPETQALQAYMSSIFSDTRPAGLTEPASPDTSGIMITVHSYSELVLFPWGWSKEPAPNSQGLATLGRKFGYFTGYGVCQSGSTNCLYQADGVNDDWAYGELGVAAYTFELGTEFFQSCSIFESNILEDNIQALLYGFKAARLPYQLPAGPEVTQVHLSAQIISPTDQITLTAMVDDTRYDSNGPWGSEPTQVISAARYSIDVPSWISGTRLYPFNAEAIPNSRSENQVATLVTSMQTDDLLPGRHTIFVEGQDGDGNWGVPTARFITVARRTYDAALSAEISALEATLGADAVYSVTLTNLGMVSDVYTLTVTSSWPVSLSKESVTILPGESVVIDIAVTISPTDQLPAPNIFTNTTTVEAISKGTGRSVQQIQLLTSSNPNYAAELSVETLMREVLVGETALYSLTLANQGIMADRYTVTIQSTWSASLSLSTMVISPGKSSLIQGSIGVPSLGQVLAEDARSERVSDLARITVNSQGLSGRIDEIQLTTIGRLYHHYLPAFSAEIAP
ncbi:MAG: M14 family zinc carboxypeptidase [Chloroflexota bacterium]